MKVLAVSGSRSARKQAVERLVDRLGREGRVGTVTRTESEGVTHEATDDEQYRRAGARCQYQLSDDGWRATGVERSLDDVLDELARECSYAVVDGFDDPGLPRIVVGDQPASDGETIARAPSAEALDVGHVVEAVKELDPFETLGSLIATVKQSADQDKAGAIATFTGRVRQKEDEDDAPTELLEFERYDEVAAEKMATIRSELEDREGVYEVLLHHRTGVVEAGEDIVFVVVLAGHREEAFETVEDGIDRLKDEVPLFKKEVTAEETFWAHQHEHEHHPDETAKETYQPDR